jgi:hypothetical protein
VTDSPDTWTLTVYVDGVPSELPFTAEKDARDEAQRLEREGWADGIPDSLRAPDGSIVWHRPHDAAG